MFNWDAATRLRFLTCIAAVGFLGQAGWVLAPAIMKATDVSSGKGIEKAAALAVIRGDLWTDALTAPRSSQQNSNNLKSIANQALHMAPLNAATWLWLARAEENPAKHDVFLKMAYYTGPNDMQVMGPRLYETLTSTALTDPDIRDFIKHDLRIVLTRLPGLKPQLINAYRAAPRGNQKQIDQLLVDLDPSFSLNP